MALLFSVLEKQTEQKTSKHNFCEAHVFNRDQSKWRMIRMVFIKCQLRQWMPSLTDKHEHKLHFCCLWQMCSAKFCSFGPLGAICYINSGNYQGFGANYSRGQKCNAPNSQSEFPNFGSWLLWAQPWCKLLRRGRRFSGSSSCVDIPQATKNWLGSICISCIKLAQRS